MLPLSISGSVSFWRQEVTGTARRGGASSPKVTITDGTGWFFLSLLLILARTGIADANEISAPEQVFVGHNAPVSTVDFFPDGETLLTAGFDGVARLWRRSGGDPLHVLTGHDGWIHSAAISGDGRRVATGGADGSIRLWDAESGEVVGTFSAPWGAVTALAFSTDGERLASGSSNGATTIWSVLNQEPVRSFGGGGGAVSSVAFAPDGIRVLAGDWEGGARLWDTTTGGLIREFRGHTAAVTSATFWPSGASVLTGSLDGTARFWQVATGEEIRRFQAGAPVSAATMSAAHTMVVTATVEGAVRIWNLATGATITTWLAHDAAIGSVALSPDGMRLLTGGGEGAARLWWTFPVEYAVQVQETPLFGERIVGEHETGVMRLRNVLTTPIDLRWGTLPEGFTLAGDLRPLAPRETREFTVRFTPRQEGVLAGPLVLSASNLSGSETIILSGEGVLYRPIHTMETQAQTVHAADLSVNGRHLITGGADRAAIVRDTHSGEILALLPDHGATVQAAALSPDMRFAVSASGQGRIYLWNLENGPVVEPTKNYSGHFGAIYTVSISPDGRRFVTGGWDNAVRLWCRETGDLLHAFTGHSRQVISSAFSPDGRLVLTGSADSTARLWDVEAGGLVRVFSQGAGRINAVAFSPCGRRILTGGSDGVARVWSEETGELLLSFAYGEGWVVSAAFSDDGKWLLTGHLDGRARLIDAVSGDLLRTFPATGTAVRLVRFFPGSSRVFFLGNDGRAMIWSTVVDYPTTFGEWVAALPPGNDARPDARPPGRRLANLVRYALGHGADREEEGLLPEVTGSEGGAVIFEFDRLARRPDTSIRLEVSSDLKTWDTVALAVGLGPFLPAGEGGVTVIGDLRERRVRVIDEHPNRRAFRLVVRLEE